ncbi:MAG: translation elongation factor Ts [Micrococcales bacterium]|nr:translation elongation factor Ts [Micrococcales bacterium]
MANYSMEDIKALREKTGAGIVNVKRALEEAGGDRDKAIELLRIKGLEGVANREGRSASDGLVVAQASPAADGQVGVLVELNCETDFVAKNAAFVTLADTVLAAAVASGAADAEALGAATTDEGTVADSIDTVAAALREKLVLRRVARVAGDHVEVYLHKTAPGLPPKVGVIVATDAKGASVAHDVAMHIAAKTPLWITREEVPEETVVSERRIAEEKARAEGKPDKILPKIVEGRINAFYKENVLVDQEYAKDPSKTVAKLLAEVGGTVVAMASYRVGV